MRTGAIVAGAALILWLGVDLKWPAPTSPATHAAAHEPQAAQTAAVTAGSSGSAATPVLAAAQAAAEPTPPAAPRTVPSSTAGTSAAAAQGQGTSAAAQSSAVVNSAQASTAASGTSAGSPPREAPTAAPPALMPPVPGPVLAPFGWAYSPVFADWQEHTGVDLAADVGDAVHAPAAGLVTAVRQDSLWGLVISLALNGTYSTNVSGLAHAAVRPGDRVVQGQLLGEVGPPPPAEGNLPAHVFWQLFSGLRPLDPMATS